MPAAEFAHVVSHLAGNTAHGSFIDVAVQHGSHVPIALFPTGNLRLESGLREVVDLIDPQFDLVEKLLHVDVITPADVDDAKAFVCDRRDTIKAINIGDHRFNSHDDLFFNVLR